MKGMLNIIKKLSIFLTDLLQFIIFMIINYNSYCKCSFRVLVYLKVYK